MTFITETIKSPSAVSQPDKDSSQKCTNTSNTNHNQELFTIFKSQKKMYNAINPIKQERMVNKHQVAGQTMFMSRVRFFFSFKKVITFELKGSHYKYIKIK